ncbi:MAG: peroxiredoxin [Candidatus Limnocylindrales bacterium]
METSAPTSEPSIPQVGEAAPAFALPDADGAIHRLADRRGTYTVVYFYPADDTPGCTIEACGFRDANEDIVAGGTMVWGISPQGTASKAAFRSKYGLSFPLLADEDHAVAEAYGSWVERERYGQTSMGIARRTFLVGPDGTIAHVWEKVKPEGHAEDVLATVRAAQERRTASPA